MLLASLTQSENPTFFSVSILPSGLCQIKITNCPVISHLPGISQERPIIGNRQQVHPILGMAAHVLGQRPSQ
jgi:hypothetical protein